MNDRLRFRVWDKESSEYLVWGCTPDYQLEIDLTNGKLVWQSMPDDGDEYPKELDTKHLVIEQCTGLKDKNGRLIYEGDIVKRISKHDEEEPTVLLQVEWNNKGGRYVTTDKKHSTWTFSYFDYEYEVIGNIHENSELLEGK